MAKRIIKRDQTGGPVQPVAQGQVSRIVEANVTYPDNLDGTVSEPAHENIIWRTATGNVGLHQSANVRNMPQGAIGYIHSINNVCFAVSRLDTARNTMELCGGVGHVNAGVHIF